LILHGAAPEEARLDDTMIIGAAGRFEVPNRGTGFSFSCMVPELGASIIARPSC
jgi:hypothetical protein